MTNMKKKIILYVEDCVPVIDLAEDRITKNFPTYKFLNVESKCSLDHMIEEGKLDLKDITLICMDGNLGDNCPEGWEIAQVLRGKGFENPILYISDWDLPEGKAELFNEIGLEKIPIDTIRKYLKS